MSQATKEKLWLELVVAGMNQVGSTNLRMNAIIEVADATVDRYERRFCPEDVDSPESVARRAAVAADVKLQEGLQNAYYENEKRKAADKIRNEGPWAVGTRLKHKPTGTFVIVVEDEKGPQVRCRMGESNHAAKRPLLRVDLEWANDGDVVPLATVAELPAAESDETTEPAAEPEASEQAQ